MQTIKLYSKDVYLTECSSVVLELKEVKGKIAVILDRTVFFPASGGQPCDTGTVASLESGVSNEITGVYEESGQIFHITGECSLKPGESVKCIINWKRRFDHMQRHCGEHILSGVFFREYGGVNRGFHMGDEYMTIDISLEGDPNIKEVTWDMAMFAEKRANEIILSNAPVATRYFDDPAELSKLPLRKAVTASGDISIVCVGDISDPADCVACCGTHPSSAGQAGLVKIYKVEHYKGMFRVFFEAGERALDDYRLKHGIISELNYKYSANTHDLLEKIDFREEKTKMLKEELNALKQTVLAGETADIEEEIRTGGNVNIIVREFQNVFKADDVMRACRPFCEMPGMDKLLLIISPGENTLFLFSNGKKYDCGKLIKENVQIYNGKCGGNASSARAFFPNREYLDTFIDLIEKHLRSG